MAEATPQLQRGAFQRLGIARWFTVAAAGLLAACSTVVPRPPVPVAAPVRAAPAAADTEVQAGIPRDIQRNRVALLVPLSGGNAGVGQSIANATMLALLDTQNQSVRVTNYDTAPGAAAAARRAIAEGAQLILGPLLADDVRAVAPVARAAGVPVISFSNDAGVAGGGTYVMGYAPVQSIGRVVAYASGRGVTSFAGLVPNGLYGQRASTAFLRAVETAGGKVVSLQTFARTPAAITAATARLGGQGAYDAVLIADGGAPASQAAAQVKRGVNAGTRILGTELWNSEAGIAARPALAGAWYASVSDTWYRQFATKYRGRFGVTPYRLSSLGYDAVLLTVRIARDWRVGSPFPEARLRDGDGFSGIDGAFRFGRDGIAERALEVKEIRGGATTVVSPAPSGFAR
jgi:ABC-type branched-subunit amino acid transport system substrate-binding protein